MDYRVNYRIRKTRGKCRIMVLLIIFQSVHVLFFSVNACSFTQRDVKSIKKKWIERRRDQKKTGGGPPQLNLKPWKDKVYI